MRKRRAWGAVLAFALVVATCIPQAAWAYFSLPAINVSFGTSSLNLGVGQTGTVAVVCDKWSEEQLPGCGMVECPQACSTKVTPDGVLGGCLSADGWCTCAGLGYSTYYTQLTVASSNPSVCRASVSGSTLNLTAYAPGSATITVTASLSKHADARASMTVNVSEGGSASAGSHGNAQVSGAGSGSGSSGSAGSGSGGDTVTVTTSVLAQAAAQAQAQAQATGEDPQVVEMTREDGSVVIVAEATDASAAKQELAKIVGTNGTCTFWSGGTMDSPLLSMTFHGDQLSPDADLDIDPSVEITRKGSGAVASLLADAPDDTVVMEFAHEGKLPAPAEVYVRASSVFQDGTEVGLYCFNEEAAAFDEEQNDIVVSDGYAVFTLEHCSDWALSPSDLSALVMPEGVDASKVNVHAGSALPFLIGGVAVVVIAAVAVAAVVTRRKKSAVAKEDVSVEEGAVEEVG